MPVEKKTEPVPFGTVQVITSTLSVLDHVSKDRMQSLSSNATKLENGVRNTDVRSALRVHLRMWMPTVRGNTILEINIRTLDEKVHLLTRKVHEHVDKRLILCMSALGIDHCLHSAWH